jgi:hypothetical protein
MLVNRAHDMVEHERLRFVAATPAIRTQQAELEHRLVGPRSAILAAEENLLASRAELTDADMVARHAHEAHHSEAFLRNRRESQRRHRIEAAEKAYQSCLAEQAALHDERARVNEALESQLAVARLHAVRIFAHTAARISTYWEGLVLAHRDGAHLAALLPHLSPRLPDWVMAPADADLTDTDHVDPDDQLNPDDQLDPDEHAFDDAHPLNDAHRLNDDDPSPPATPDPHEFPQEETPMPAPGNHAHSLAGVTPNRVPRELSPRGGRR